MLRSVSTSLALAAVGAAVAAAAGLTPLWQLVAALGMASAGERRRA